jgi:hypothetical protein
MEYSMQSIQVGSFKENQQGYYQGETSVIKK